MMPHESISIGSGLAKLTLAMMDVTMPAMTVCSECIMLAFSSVQSMLLLGALRMLLSACSCAALLMLRFRAALSSA